jgi:hypothetical protein
VGASFTDASAVLTGTWGPDQDVSATVHTINQNDACFQEAEIRLRNTITPRSITGYEVGWHMSVTSQAYLIIVRWNGPLASFDYLFVDTNAQYAVKDGDVLRAKIVGNIITAYINGVQKAQADITSPGFGAVFTTGNPGMGFNLENPPNVPQVCSGTNGDYGFTSYTATDVPLP